MNNTKLRVLFAKGKSNNLTEREGLSEETAAARSPSRHGSARLQKNDQTPETQFQQTNSVHSATNSAVRKILSPIKPESRAPSGPADLPAPAGNSM